MKIEKLLTVIAFSVAVVSSTKAAVNFNSTVMSVECSEVSTNNLHITCKANEIGLLGDALVNYDVKDDTGKIVATGSGCNISVENANLTPGAIYTIQVVALVNGEVEAQTISRQMPK